MSITRHFSIQLRRLKEKAKQEILVHRVQYHNPTLRCDYPTVWRYAYDGLDAIQLGQNVYVMAFTEILVYKHTHHSSKEGGLIVGDNSVIATGVNLRAAGGRIIIGENSGIGEYSVLIAANHAVHRGGLYLKSRWDEERTDVVLGDNVWIGAGCYLLPGCEVGDNSVVGAGSVVNKKIPPNEIWAGAPARKIKDVPFRAADESCDGAVNLHDSVEATRAGELAN
ncbi:MAG TPA: acyltransferase [Rhodothermales bacterium]|nr:acyltransferase [Rhodothermales bacterium]